MTKDEIIKYWLDSSEVDFKAMESLFIGGHYVWAVRWTSCTCEIVESLLR